MFESRDNNAEFEFTKITAVRVLVVMQGVGRNALGVLVV